MVKYPNILFFDLEVNEDSKRIQDTGAVFQDLEIHSPGINPLIEAMDTAEIWCGHNIIGHDLPYLSNLVNHPPDKRIIDTLYLSALLFPKKPYHNLVKGYKLRSDSTNNPLKDAKLSIKLLNELIQQWHKAPPDLQYIYFHLLKNESGFNGFFKSSIIHQIPDKDNPEVLNNRISSFFENKLCLSSEIESFIRTYPIELAYALALINTNDTNSVHPAWILKNFPKVNPLLQKLRLNFCNKDNCTYCSSQLDPIKALKQNFGYPSFRKFSDDEIVPLQEEVVRVSLASKSFLAIFPTGGGKSLTFQLPAIMKAKATRALTVIISPLQSLMKDQVDNLKSKGIEEAVSISGLLSPLERAEAIERVAMGGANLLYIAPESLRSRTIFKLLKKRSINRFVIDEAHCFSSWGHDFRVDYLFIAKFIENLSREIDRKTPIPISCFTATAKPEVVKDICQYFKNRLDLDLDIFQTSVERKNLQFFVLQAKDDDEKKKYLIDLIQNREGPKIIYVSRVKRAKELAELLQRNGFPDTRPFYGDLKPEEKTGIQDGFMKGEIETIVATTAFGMGVDKDDVQTVIHYNISDSLENYIQEAGRGGRNPKLTAHCYVLFQESDLDKHFDLLNMSKLSFKEVSQIWRGIKKYKRSTIVKSPLELAEISGWDTDMRELSTRVKTAISTLEEENFVERGLNASRVFAVGILSENVEEAHRVIDKKADLFRESSTALRDAKRIAASLIKEKYQTLSATQADYLAKALDLDRAFVISCFQHFKQIGILSSEKDLSCNVCLLQEQQSPRNSRRIFKKFSVLEKKIFPVIFSEEETYYRKFFLKTLLEELNRFEEIKKRKLDFNLMDLRKIIQYWQIAGFLSKKNRIDAASYHYEIARNELFSKPSILERQELAGAILEALLGHFLMKTNQGKPVNREKALVEFSILELQKKVGFLSRNYTIEEIEKALLYLHHIGSIELDKGLIIFYNPMIISRKIKDNNRRYTRDDFTKLENFYQSKTEQIHIVEEYVKKQYESNEVGKRYVNDYFEMDREAFLEKYFPNRKNKIKRSISERRFKELFSRKELSKEQRAIIQSRANRIFVAAGPGSGKTHVLIRKVAKLLLVEDTKPDNFLMLTFSRPAALEIKKRLFKIIGNMAWQVDVFTFHSYAFQLLGRLGNIEQSHEVIARATTAIKEDEVLLDRLMSKSVLLIDEYQDVSNEIYNFIQAIIRKAGNIRVIAVGDDDQNIFEFAQANVAHMRSFLKLDKVVRFDLTYNFRARKTLVDFSNRFLDLFPSDRIKKNIVLTAIDEREACLEIIAHQSSKLILPIVKDLLSRDFKGRVGVLTRTNDEALLIHTCLLDSGRPSQLVAAQEGFQLRNIVEIRTFTDIMRNHPNTQTGFIPDLLWQEKKLQLFQKFTNSQNLSLIKEIFFSFEKDKLLSIKENPESEKITGYLFQDWVQFLYEIKKEHFALVNDKQIFVSTMHKAKGKQFDHVFLSLQDFRLRSPEEKRLLYVAMTRAKQSLIIHTNTYQFNDFEQSVPSLMRRFDSVQYPDPKKLVFACGLKDVNLNSMKRNFVQSRLILMNSGDPLKIVSKEEPFQYEANKAQFWISRGFRSKIEPYLNQGYRVTSSSIANLVFWKCPEENKEFLIALPEVVLEKDEVKEQ